ncbi:cystathionine gamma-synthase family protein [Aquincola tertiaricarbonis]|uniref:Cystathionine gamma-synthase family protein n=1 Tax=Aquincola tertiaricarbonis TaxID=391953 RepID=A0ABY4S9C2_AQUTE|nr:cystathionine gamma-synthase family protein [Aquincola tertiaricarbonis]URI09574.1 cystathionine gamma-synthase family protein [Aquincola tertiaricarbonis]
MSDYGFTTRTVHAAQDAGAEHGAVHMPIHTSVQYGFQKVEDLIGVFQGRIKGGFNYARQGTPTTAALEALITRMEGGVGSVSFATGMAAITATFLTLLRAGDHVVSSKFVFGNTNSLLGTLADLGIQSTKVDTGSVAHVEAALQPNTRLVFVETISNPGTRIPDLAAIGQLCRERGIVYVVDNTVTSPYLFQPKSVGASLVINALTKSIAGHGDALGGTVTDTGLFDWQGYPNIFASYRSGDARQWGLTQIRKKGLRDMGGALSSDHAHRILVGAETLELRCDRTSATALALARWLQAHPAVAQVHYPMLENHPQHAAARRYFKSGSWLLSFELADPQRLVPVIDKLRLPVSATGLADTRSLIIPVAPTIFWEAGAAVRADMGIADGMIRLSVGLEDERDLIADFEQALA